MNRKILIIGSFLTLISMVSCYELDTVPYDQISAGPF